MAVTGDEFNPSSAALRTIRDIENGVTPYQKNRELRRRALITGIQAGLGGIAGGITAHRQDVADQEAAELNKQKAIHNQVEGVIARTGGNGVPEVSQVQQRMRLGDQMSDTTEKIAREASIAQAKANLAKLGTAEAQLDSPVLDREGKPVWSPTGMEKHAQETQLNAADINLGRDMLKEQTYGGLMRSMRGQ